MSGFNMDSVVGAYGFDDDDDEGDGQVMEMIGDMMGDHDDEDDDDEDDDDDDDVMGAKILLRKNPKMLKKLLFKLRRAKGRRGRARFLRVPPKPRWRDQLAPGVNTPGIGLWPLPLTGLQNDGVLDDTTSQIEYRGTPQKPFRGERIVIVVNRSALALNAVRIAAITVGTTPQLADIGELAVEAFAPDAVGVRLKLDQATPGVLYRIICRAVGAIPVGESIAISPQVLGRVVRS